MRELNDGFIPSAGVGTGFTKRAFQQLAISTDEIFSPNTLTEDYQLGLRMNLQGMKAAFVNIRIPPSEENPTEKTPTEWVATRALFPTDFKHAVKQKTRWNIGIILQGWANLGWRGSLGVKWDLLQDRKGLDLNAGELPRLSGFYLFPALSTRSVLLRHNYAGTDRKRHPPVYSRPDLHGLHGVAYVEPCPGCR